MALEGARPDHSRDRRSTAKDDSHDRRGTDAPRTEGHGCRRFRRSRMDGLTGLRALAALWVVGFHYTVGPLSPLTPHDGAPVLRLGYLAVDLFFMLSGFVIWHVHGAEFRRPSVTAFRRFLGLRFARLYPVYALAMVLMALVVLLGPPLGDPAFNPRNYQPAQFVVDLAMLQTWGLTDHLNWNYPAWSVSAELFCYMLFPLIAPVINRLEHRTVALAAVAIIGCLAGLYLSVYGRTMNEALGLAALSRAMLEFVEGCLLRRLADSRLVAAIPWSLPVLLLTVAIAAVANIDTPLADFMPVLAFPLLILAGSNATSPIGRIIAWRPLVAIGAASYSLYLLQAPVEKGARFLAAHIATGHPLTSAAAISSYGLILAVLTVSVHRLVEVPARRGLRRRIA